MEKSARGAEGALPQKPRAVLVFGRPPSEPSGFPSQRAEPAADRPAPSPAKPKLEYWAISSEAASRWRKLPGSNSTQALSRLHLSSGAPVKPFALQETGEPTGISQVLVPCHRK